MAIIDVVVRNRIAKIADDVELVCNNHTDVLQFSFDAEWDDYPYKTARFAWADAYIDVPFSGNQVQVPELSNVNYVYVGVYSEDLTTTPVRVRCKTSVLCLGDFLRNPPTNPFYDDFSERLETVEKVIASGGGGTGSYGIATRETLGVISVGDNLIIDKNGRLSVDTATAVEQDNTRPVTSAAVHTELGNIEALLANI